jgi:hypothetical protein
MVTNVPRTVPNVPRTMPSFPRMVPSVPRTVPNVSVPAMWLAVRCIYVTPIAHMADGTLRISHTRHSHGRQCVMHVTSSLTWQAVCYARPSQGNRSPAAIEERREGDPNGWSTVLVTALGSWEKTVPRRQGYMYCRSGSS